MFRRLLRSVLTAATLAALLFGWSAPAAHAIQQPENDDPFDTAGFNGVPEDTLQTKPLADFFPPIKWQLDFKFDVDLKGGIFNKHTEVNTNLNQTFEPQYTEEEQFQKQSEQNPTPRSGIQLSTTIVQPGAEVTAVGQAENYVTGDGRDIFYAWSVNNVSANGTVAGADPLDPPTASAPNGLHTRRPAKDSDGDGMDDDWEVRYGLNPHDPSDASQNPDGDGYTNTVYKNHAGDVLTVTPPSSCGAEFDGSNLCEYVWGTDPFVADTDGDGFTDGQDIAGLGQVSLTFKVPADAKPGDTLEVRLTTLGKSLQQFDRETSLTKVDSQAVQVRVGDSEQVAAALAASTTTPIPGQHVTLTTTLGQTAYHPGLLTYSWFINGQFQANGSGESRATFDYEVPSSAKPGDTINVGVRALNFTTGQEADAALDLRVSDIVQLHYDPTQVVPGQPYTVNATLLSGSVDPANLVFHWTKDGQPVPDQSGPGKTTFTETTDGNPGDQFDLGLRVTTPDDSQTFGEVQAVVGVQEPSVDIVTTDSFIEPGQSVELTAVPAHFKSTQLEFRWSIDGVAQDVPLDARTIDVTGTDVNNVITIDVDVRTAGAGAEVAHATEFETVVAPGTVAAAAGAASPSPTAALSATLQAVRAHPLLAALGMLGATSLGALAIVAAKRRTYARSRS